MASLKLSEVDAKHIVISRTDKIGDIILSIPAFNMVHNLFPKSKITVIANSYNYTIISKLTIIDEIILIDKTPEDEIINKLKSADVDIFISLFTNSQIGRIAYKSKAKIRIAPLSKLHSYFIYNYGIRQKRSNSLKNEAEYNLDLVRLLNADRFDKLYDIEIKISYTKYNSDYIETFIKNNFIKDNFIIINPFSGGSAKNLTVNEYFNLSVEIKKLLPETDIIVISSEFEKGRLANFLNDEHFKIYINNNDILNLASLIDKAGLFIGGSTGSTHIAGNLRKLSACFYPANHNQGYNRWGLFGNENNTLYIVPDKDKEDMIKNTIFNNLSTDNISSYAKKIVEFYNAKTK